MKLVIISLIFMVCQNAFGSLNWGVFISVEAVSGQESNNHISADESFQNENFSGVRFRYGSDFFQFETEYTKSESDHIYKNIETNYKTESFLYGIHINSERKNIFHFALRLGAKAFKMETSEQGSNSSEVETRLFNPYLGVGTGLTLGPIVLNTSVMSIFNKNSFSYGRPDMRYTLSAGLALW